jgi:hypothetical protein
VPDYLTPAERRLLDAFLARLHAAAPGAVTAVRVFGSRARGTSTPESDLDVAVEPAAGADLRALHHIVADAGWDATVETDGYALGLAPMLVPPGPLHGVRAAIAREGLTIWQAAPP